MIRLVALDQVNNREHELDTYGNENIGLTLQVDDVRNIENKNASYSKEFNLPATKNNNKFFEHFYDLNRYTLNFNVYKNLKVFLYVDDILVIEGFMRLVNSADKSTEISYNVVIFNDVVNIIETLSDDTIENLSFSDIAHEFTTVNIIASWTGTTVLTAGGTTDDVYYPLINTGAVHVDNGQLYVDTYKNFLLNIRLKYLLDKIFNYAGFTYRSDFLNSSTFTEIFMDCGQQIDGEAGSDFANAQIHAFTTLGTDLGNTGYTLSPAEEVTLTFANEEGDVDNLFNIATGVFTAPFDCVVQWEVTLGVSGVSAQSYTNLVVNNVVGGQVQAGLGDLFLWSNTGTTQLFSGQTLTFNLEQLVGTTFIRNTLNDDNSSVRINVVDITTDTNIKLNRGDIKLADVLKDIFTMFNLTVESLGNNTLKIEPYVDFISDTVVDWTSKVNINQKVIEPIDIPKRITLKHSEDSNDYYHEQYKLTQFIDYGCQILEFDVENSDNLEIKLNVFAAPYIQDVAGSNNIVLQHMAQQDTDGLIPFDNKPRLIYKNPNGFVTAYPLEDINDANGFNTWNDYGFINNGTHYDGSADNNPPIPQLTANSNSLLFGYTPLSYTPSINAQPLNTLYIKYWFDYLFEKFSVTNGLLVRYEIYLKPNDINDFSFGYKVKIQDQLYRVNKIEYNTDVNSLAKVELLRI